MNRGMSLNTALPPGAPSRSTWQIWTAAPHRVMFLLGVTQTVLTVAWWLIDLGGRYAGWYAAPSWTVPPGWAHAFLMVYALFPLFVFGFTMTAVPNWTGRRLDRPAWLGTAVPLAAGIALFYAGLVLDRGLAALGVAFMLAGWLTGVFHLARLVAANRAKDKHALGLVVVLCIGAAGVALFGWSLHSGDWRHAEVSRRASMWLFLLPLFMVVSHRLIPFFSSRVIRDYVIYRPRGSLLMLATGCGAHFLLELYALTQWTWLVDFPMAAWVGYLALRWGLTQSFRVKLLSMLHLALVMLAAALAFHGVASLAELLGYPGLFGLGPLHALAIAYFTAMTVAMVSRVSLGHSGRALEADPLTWRCFQAVLAVALIRVVSDFAFLPAGARIGLLLAAAAAWLAVLGPWSARYAPMYLRPRADGKPG